MKILLIEDQENLCKILKSGLEQNGFNVKYFLDGDSGFQELKAHRHDYDAVVLDLMLPKKNGEKICKSIRKLNITTPVLILTAKNSPEDKTTLLNAGADDYLTKPFSFSELKARIRAVARRPKTSFISKLRFRNLLLNPITKKVYQNGKKISLTTKEFSIMECLMRHPNQALNRETLLSGLCEFNYDGFSNIIDVHIRNIRKKLKTDPIETIRGIGYRLRGNS